MTPAHLCRFPNPVPYAQAVSLQQHLVQLRIRDTIPDTFLLLQHPPVITLGRRGRREHLLASPDRLAAAGIELHQASRGGDVTYHAPGQWVLYPILKLGPRELGAHGYLKALESVALLTALDCGVPAFRRNGKAGAWCQSGKFAAVGFAFTRWVTWHGLSLNVNLNLSGFDLIVGCGLVGEPVTSLQHELGSTRTLSLDETATVLTRHVESVFARRLSPHSPEELPAPPPPAPGSSR